VRSSVETYAAEPVKRCISLIPLFPTGKIGF
jgi:hypothetical protein